MPDFTDWRSQANSFAAMAAYAYGPATYLAPEGAERWIGYRVTHDLTTMLGVAPEIGRPFAVDDDRPGAEPVALLSHAVWASRFASDPAVVGSSIVLDGARVTVVGVMPTDFDFPSPVARFWVPLRADPITSEVIGS